MIVLCGDLSSAWAIGKYGPPLEGGRVVEKEDEEEREDVVVEEEDEEEREDVVVEEEDEEGRDTMWW